MREGEAVALDFTLSESQQVLQKNAKEFAERVLEPIVEKIDRSADAWESFLAGREAYRQTALAGSVVSMSTYQRPCWHMGWPCTQ
jgi:hypothetical protein